MNPQDQSSQPAPHAVPPPYQPAAPSHHSDTAQTFLPTKNKPALISYYCGVFGLIPLLGLPLSVAAVVLGFMGLSRFKVNPTPGAKGHAIAGLSLGIFELVVFLLFIILVAAG